MEILGLILCGLLWGFPAAAGESDLIRGDRQALAEAVASGSSFKIMAAKEQLSDDLSMQAELKRKDAEGMEVPLTSDGQGHWVADVVINGDIHASLVVDTGSPVVMLTSAFAQQLGIDPDSPKAVYVEFLNGKYKAAPVTLDILRAADAEAESVNSVVLLEESHGFKQDGLLGMSFLKRFHFSLDEAGQKLVLRKLAS